MKKNILFFFKKYNIDNKISELKFEAKKNKRKTEKKE